MSEHVAYPSDSLLAEMAVSNAKAAAKAQGRRVRTLVGVKAQSHVSIIVAEIRSRRDAKRAGADG